MSRATVVKLVGLALVALASCYAYNGIDDVKTTSVLSASVRFATPLVLGALCGLLGERTGVINIGIEGQMLTGAFVGFFAAVATGSILFGVAAAAVSGILLGTFLAVCAVSWRTDQIIAGTVITILATGLTSYLYTPGKVLPSSVAPWKIPVLGDLPLVGRVLFDLSPLQYFAALAAVGLHVLLFRTRWGLRSRAVGEHPSSADTVGVSVWKLRYLNVALAGGLAGLAGAHLSIESASTFERGMSNGQGFTALAIMIFGWWKPFGALAGALFFGFLLGLTNQLQFDKVIDIPPQFVSMLAPALTIAVLAILGTRVRPPAAAGTPYTKE